LFLVCGLLRGQSNGSFSARVQQTAKGKSKGPEHLQEDKRERGRTLLRAHIPRNPLQSLRGACKVSDSFVFIFLVVLIASSTPYIYIHLELVFPRGVYC
jgi:hypothetical protein